MEISPKKSLGQNFLINQGVIERIIKASEINSNDLVVEIGPGTGNLTKYLARHAGKVIAIEKDRRIIEMLRKEMPANVQVVEADVLKLEINKFIENWKLENGNYKIIANIPYYITSHFLRILLESWPTPSLAVLMVQKEVAQRMMAKPPPVRGKASETPAGHARRADRTSNGMNMLALSVQYYADVEKIMDVSRGSFRPMPKVESSVIRLNPKHEIRNPKESEILFKLARAAFAGKRKQLIGTLPQAMGLNREAAAAKMAAAGIDPTARPETLALTDWLTLVKEL